MRWVSLGSGVCGPASELQPLDLGPVPSSCPGPGEGCLGAASSGWGSVLALCSSPQRLKLVGGALNGGLVPGVPGQELMGPGPPDRAPWEQGHAFP